MKLVIDRFEEDFAVLQTPEGDTVNIPRPLVGDAHEGDFVRIETESGADALGARRNRLNRLFGKDK